MKNILIVFYTAIFLLSACKEQNRQSESVPIVKISEVLKYGEEKAVSFPGKVKASSEINLAFRISGPIAKINVKEGEFIKKGQVLAEMDSRDYAIQFSATEAEYKQVKAEAERVIQLYEKQSVPENDYDKAVSGLQQITAKYDAHKNALNDTKLIAPFDGYVQKRYFDKDETISAGMPVLSIISSDMPEVEINIPAGEFIRRDKFGKFACSFAIYPDKIFPLELIAINQKANLNQLYTARLKMIGDKKTQLPTAGMSTIVDIYFKPEDTDLLTIPIGSMFEKNGQSCVWIYDKNSQTVNIRNITITEIQINGMLVVSRGLEAGEKVVTAGVRSLSDGEKIKLLPQVSKTNVGGLL
ncbi:MAG: efflux RND transporter periplasmic adaptor subunit [Prevotellaceae bacterium]|jgi:RND family efflux transporter MFP subunit|nr:efflux RND transporter periplasmic adaptor subunit [Prevotellaceae bacterium]